MIRNCLAVMKWLTSCSLAGALFFAASFAALAQQPRASTKPAPANPRALPTDTGKWKGDFDGMVKRRQIRFVVPYSRTLYFNDKGHERGVTADSARIYGVYFATVGGIVRESRKSKSTDTAKETT